MKLSDRALRFGVKPVVFLASLVPAAYLTWAALTDHLTANPLSEYRNETGVWTLRFLCVSLAVTPLRRLTGWNAAIKFRRMLGLYAFFYASLHFVSYLVFDRFAGLDFPDGIVAWATVRGLIAAVADDVVKRPYITVGFLSFIIMLALAVTSTAGMIRRMGRRWQKLHQLVYVSAIAAVVHYWWLVKADIKRPAAYAGVVAVLLGFRLYRAIVMRPSMRGATSRAAAT